MGRRYETVSFLSDYGLEDEFVGIVHSVLRSIAPHAAIIDVTHGVPAFDIRAGALALARSAQYLCSGVVLAIVDPGVATDRRAVAVEVGDGDSVLVGPDNGLLAPAVAMVGGATRAVSLTESAYQLPTVGRTFAGRDIFAPAAAHLASGVDLTNLGEEVDVAGLVPGVMPVSVIEADRIHAEVLWSDRYGNVQINVDPAELEQLAGANDTVEIRIGERVRTAQRVVAFDEVPPGGLGLIVDSYGLVALVVARSSAAADLGVGPGDAIVLVGTDGPAGLTTTVDLSSRPANRNADRSGTVS
ncbi:MAG: SAM-dependent chlorinase/fluorinase [Actinomycetota bacterium]|nr:SAM-dependent chlorinase/fluorinase [Actinomycetota bacterium]